MDNFIEVYNDRVTYPTVAAVASAVGCHPRTVNKRVKKLRDKGVTLIDRSNPNSTPSIPDAKKEPILESHNIDIEPVRIETSFDCPDGCDHFMIPDTQCKPDISLDYLSFVGQYIADRKPEVIIHIGDHADMESLSSYDKGKRSAEGRRVYKDIEAARLGMNTLLQPIKDLQDKERRKYGHVKYKPRMVLTLGNHEQRIQRHVEAHPELEGFLGYDSLMYEENGWEVHDFLKPVVINGVAYVHYMANPMSGKPYGGVGSTMIKNIGESFSMGHQQKLDVATRFLPASGKQQWAIIAGACYEHDEGYKGHQGNHHWRGVVVKHHVVGGNYCPMFVDLGYLRRRYGSSK